MNNDYDPKIESARFTAYWQGYDRGFIDGRADGCVMPEPKFPHQEAAQKPDANPTPRRKGLHVIWDGSIVNEFYADNVTAEMLAAGISDGRANPKLTAEQARYAYDQALKPTLPMDVFEAFNNADDHGFMADMANRQLAQTDPLDMAEEGPRNDRRELYRARIQAEMAKDPFYATPYDFDKQAESAPRANACDSARPGEHNHIWDEENKRWRFLGPVRHNFIRSDGSPMTEPACR